MSNLAYITSVFIGYIGTGLDWFANKRLPASAEQKMVEINNQRRSSICWRGRRELITDVRKPERWDDVIVGGELFTDYPITRKLAAKPKTQINRRRTLPASFPLVWMLNARPFERLLSEKSGRCGIAGD